MRGCAQLYACCLKRGGELGKTSHAGTAQVLRQLRPGICAQVALQEQRHENNAAAARQLKLIERLRADKDSLSAKCLTAASELKASHALLCNDGWRTNSSTGVSLQAVCSVSQFSCTCRTLLYTQLAKCSLTE